MTGWASPVRGIVSGGQTGVDRAALDAALATGVPCRGWCPAGRMAEDGVIPRRYPLRSTPSSEPSQRTTWNVRDADATLILSPGRPRGGTALTAEIARSMGRPLLIAGLEPNELAMILEWLEGMKRASGPWVNVAGPRESEAPGVYQAARALLTTLLRSRATAVAPPKQGG